MAAALALVASVISAYCGVVRAGHSVMTFMSHVHSRMLPSFHGRSLAGPPAGRGAKYAVMI
eukprot:3591735-Pyramimonas_sp.AAC.1